MKIKRQSKILELVKTYDIETQEELSARLEHDGFKVTQATVSRDIRELNLSKIQSDSGKQKYCVFSKSGTEAQYNERLIRIIVDGLVSIDYAQNMIVIKTMQGMAMALAAALDSMNIQGIVGCIAGDDTIFCCAKTEVEAISVINRLKVYVTAD